MKTEYTCLRIKTKRWGELIMNILHFWGRKETMCQRLQCDRRNVILRYNFRPCFFICIIKGHTLRLISKIIHVCNDSIQNNFIPIQFFRRINVKEYLREFWNVVYGQKCLWYNIMYAFVHFNQYLNFLWGY